MIAQLRLSMHEQCGVETHHFGTAQATARGRAEALLNRDESNVTFLFVPFVTLPSPNRQESWA
jgi:hypothetical protein